MKTKLFVTILCLTLLALRHNSDACAQNLFVSNGSSGGDIQEYDASGAYLGYFPGDVAVPTGLAFDSNGDLYVASFNGCAMCGLGTGYIEEFDQSGNFVSIIRSAGGLYEPEGLAFDSAGNLYAANAGNIVKFTFSGGVLSSNGTFFSSPDLDEPAGLAFDRAGNLFVASSGNNAIEEFNPSGVGTVFASSGLNAPQGLAFDSAGNLFVSNSGDNTIEKFTASGVGTVFVSTGLDSPDGLAFGTNGDLYVVNSGDSTIAEFDPSGTEDAVLTGGLNQPHDLAFDTIPEPSTFPLAALGVVLLCSLLKRKRT
jgi:DNA-binding beta-propeller fold protein YncE